MFEAYQLTIGTQPWLLEGKKWEHHSQATAEHTYLDTKNGRKIPSLITFFGGFGVTTNEGWKRVAGISA